MDFIEVLSATLSLIMIIPVFIGILLLIKNSNFKRPLNPTLSKLTFFNTFAYSALLVLAMLEINGRIGFVVLSFGMLPTYLFLCFGRYQRWQENRIRPVKKLSRTDHIKMKIRRKARKKYEARIESRERARRRRQKRF